MDYVDPPAWENYGEDASPHVINHINIDDHGKLYWPDGTPLPPCADCGNQAHPAWHVPDAVWERYRAGSHELCWPCFVLRMLDD